jgi:hypothetical protein
MEHWTGPLSRDIRIGSRIHQLQFQKVVKGVRRGDNDHHLTALQETQIKYHFFHGFFSDPPTRKGHFLASTTVEHWNNIFMFMSYLIPD